MGHDGRVRLNGPQAGITLNIPFKQHVDRKWFY